MFLYGRLFLRMFDPYPNEKKKDALVFKLTQFVFPCLEFYTFNDNYEIYFSLYKEVVTQ